MKTDFHFQLHTHLSSGIGSSKKIGEILKTRGLKTPVILVDEAVAQTAYFAEISDLIKNDTQVPTTETVRSTKEPDYDYLDFVADRLRSLPKLDSVIAIGGGSTLDLAKACAALVHNPGPALQYRGFDKLQVPGVPFIAIPTTAGTGSEVTINAVFTDNREKRKLGINGCYIVAAHAILDAEWTRSCPESAAISAGVDALVHTLESFSCKQANILTRALSREAFTLLRGALPAIVDDPLNLEKRQEILVGAYLAGAALFNSGSGIAGALSYPIGVHYQVPHGIAGGIFLTSVVEYNLRHGYLEYKNLLPFSQKTSDADDMEINRGFLYDLESLGQKLKIPRYLDTYGISKENVHKVAELMLPLQAAFDQNPIPFSAGSDAPEMLKKHVAQ